MATIAEIPPADYVEPSVMIDRADADPRHAENQKGPREVGVGRRPVRRDSMPACSMLMPRRFGGFEHGMDTFAEAAFEIARGCGSVGWVHPSAAYQYFWRCTAKAQEEIWADDPNGRASA